MGRFEYDPLVALQNAPKLLGMELRQNGPRGLMGGYYLNGDRHAYRRDKLKVFISRGSVWVSEEGGRCISLPQWLMEFGGAADWMDAIRMINGESQAMVWNREVRERVNKDIRYVSKDVLEGAKQYDLGKCPLFRWMCGMFDEAKVREVWNKYNVTTDSYGNAVFWYVNQEGKILYDKRIAYKDDGHRDKSFFPGRKYRVAEGFSARCYFGACLPGDGGRIYLVESEKSALLGNLYFGGRFYASGGKGNLREVESDMLLVPDMDARAEWGNKGQVWSWWEMWPDVKDIPDHADIGDMIELKLKNRKI